MLLLLLKGIHHHTGSDLKSHTCEAVENSKDPPLRWKRAEKVLGEGSFGKVFLGMFTCVNWL